MPSRLLLTALCLAAAAVAAQDAASKRAITHEDVWLMKLLRTSFFGSRSNACFQYSRACFT